MKVTFIWRGPSPYRVNFFNELGKYCNLSVLFERSPKNISDKNLKWFDEEYIGFTGIYLRGVNLLGRYWLCYDIVKYLNLLRKSDIVVIGMYSTLTQAILIMIMKLLNIKYVINSDGGFIKKESALSRYVKRILVGGAHGYLSSGKKTNEYLRYYGAKSNIYVYPFTSSSESDLVDKINDEEKNELKTHLGIIEKKIVLYSGQFIHRKGIDVLLKACVCLPDDCGVYIVGGKPTEEYLSILQANKLQNIHFIDFKTPKELVSYYKAADIYVLPTREDIWGLVINEAMSYGLPVITTDNCIAGLELINNGENGFIVPVESVSELHDKLILLLSSDDLRTQISANNRLKIRKYTIEKMAKIHIQIFNQLNSKS